MSTVVDREPELRQVRRQVGRFDRVVSMMLSVILLLSIFVIALVAMWIATQIWPVRGPLQKVEMINVKAGEEEGMAGDNPEMGENALPSTDETPMRDSALEFNDSDVVQVLASVLDSLSENEVDLSDPSQRSGDTGSGRSGAPGGEGLEGTGSGRGGVPNHARWDIQYPSQNLNEYAAMLDALGIELGVVKKGAPVTYVSQLAKGKPVLRTGGGQETRLSFRWQDAPRRQADLSLLRQKGVKVDGAVVVQFFPASVEANLLDVERRHANKPVSQIKKTRFGIRVRDSRPEFYVVEQTYKL